MKEKVKFSRNITIIFFIIFLIWALLQIISPLIAPSNTIDNLSGTTFFYDNKEKIDDMSFPLNSIYHLGDITCHQKSDRSIYINGNQMPFCSRCTAMWIGLPIGLIFMVLYSFTLDNRFLVIIILGIIPLSVDGLGQLFGFWESNNLIRLFTGIIAGIVSGIAIGLIIKEITNFRYN